MTEAVLSKANLTEEDTFFDRVVRGYHAPLVNYLGNLLKDRVKAEDLVQETFLRFYKEISYRSIPKNIPGWLYQVATNLCRDYWRSACYQKERCMAEVFPEETDHSSYVVTRYERQETRLEIEDLLHKLPSRQQEIIRLRFYKEMKLQEMAEALDCPIGTIKSRLFHAIRLLRQRMMESGRVFYEPYDFSR